MGFFYKGGGERVVIEQARRLEQRGHQVRVFSPIIYWNKTFPELKEIKAHRFVPPLPIPFPFRESLAMFASAILPFGVMSLRKFDVVLCHSQPSLWIGFRLNQLYGVPYVGYLHQLTTFLHSRPEAAGNWKTHDFAALSALLGNKPLGSFAKALDRISHVGASSLLFNSQHTKELFHDAYGLGGTVCYPGVIPPKKSSVKKRGNELLMTARHYPWKRIDLGLEVVRRLRHRPNLKLLVVGGFTELTPWLTKMARNMGVLDRVLFVGDVTSELLEQYYDEASIYIQTSVYEPFGISSLEAQSHGMPAVVWGDAGLKETVLDSETGFHATPYDVEDFAKKVDLLLEDEELLKAMSKNASRWASSNMFSWESHVDIVEETLLQARSP
jgi:glycosyltransferase involved in cell wall biosynthesis